MRAVVTTTVLLLALAPALPPDAAQAQSVNGTEAQALRDEIRRLNDRLNRLEDQSRPRAAPAVAIPQATPAAPVEPAPAAAPILPAGIVTTQVPSITPMPGEREIRLEREHPFEVIGLPKTRTRRI